MIIDDYISRRELITVAGGTGSIALLAGYAGDDIRNGEDGGNGDNERGDDDETEITTDDEQTLGGVEPTAEMRYYVCAPDPNNMRENVHVVESE
ncbi:hypothetical protein OB905_08725 [Halobacteria archaeon AArc-dxtr1]|nr:hypothetical protein [Halobacteria archaeon AArc-dxtr1]